MSSVHDRFNALERQLAAANKRIADLEAKYLALLEDLKQIREAPRLPVGLTPPLDHGHGDRGPTYQAAFERWPSLDPDAERLRNAR